MREIAGKMIGALPTTTSMIAGSMAIEMIKIIQVDECMEGMRDVNGCIALDDC